MSFLVIRPTQSTVLQTFSRLVSHELRSVDESWTNSVRMGSNKPSRCQCPQDPVLLINTQAYNWRCCGICGHGDRRTWCSWHENTKWRPLDWIHFSCGKETLKCLDFLKRCKTYFIPFDLLNIYSVYIRPKMEDKSQVGTKILKSILELLDRV